MDKKYVVKAEGLTKIFRDSVSGKETEALSGINLAIEAGCLTALTGPDGAGKTTLMRLLCGLLLPERGALQVLGCDTYEEAQAIQDRISYMPQRFGLYEDLTVMENMTLYADLHGVHGEQRQQRFARLLQMTGLEDFTERLAGKLSGGMKQKLGLACTLVRSPQLLLLDEPTAGVDPLSRRELWEILRQLLHDEGLSVIVSTAYLDEAELCGRVIILHRGRILKDGTPEELRQAAVGRCFRAVPPAGVPSRILQSALLEDRQHVADAVPDGGGVRFISRYDGAADELQAYDYFPGIKPLPVRERLEDSFMLLLRMAEDGGDEHPVFPIDYKNCSYAAGSGVQIEVKNLVCRFDDFTAVDNTSFQVRKGEIFGLLGPNGAGKTTTFRMLCGLLAASGGELSVAGVNLRAARTRARANIGYVAQKFSLYATLTVDENLEFFGSAYGIYGEKLKNRMAEVKDMFGLAALGRKPAGELPGGYKQRLSMAAALMHRPAILFLDEPTSGIDPLVRRTFWQQITALAANGTTVIITTHFMEEAEYCDRVMIQDQGRMLAVGTPDEIRRQDGRMLDNMNDAFIAIVTGARRQKGAESL